MTVAPEAEMGEVDLGRRLGRLLPLREVPRSGRQPAAGEPAVGDGVAEPAARTGEVHLVDQQYAHLRSFVVVHPLASLVVAAGFTVLAGRFEVAEGLQWWLGAMIALAVARLAQGLWRPHDPPGKRRWIHTYVGLAVLVAACWGAVVWLLAPGQFVWHVVAVSWAALIAMGAMGALAMLPYGFRWFALAAMVPGIAFFVWQWSPFNALVAVLLLFYLLHVQRVGRLVSTALVENVRGRLAAQQSALEDALTGLANRRRFEQELDRQWQLCQRNGLPLSLILLDVDGFKRYNDLYGHTAGDACLQRLGRVLARMARRGTDLVARWGGEEFACLLPGTDVQGGQAVAEAIRQRVREEAIVHDDAPVPGRRVTVSVGGCTLVPQAGIPVRVLLDAADAALYAAKRSGRDRVCWNDRGLIRTGPMWLREAG